MAQQKKTGKGKQAPTYSADAMALRLVIGLTLIALGVLIFLSTGVRLDGGVFSSVRAFFGGLAGGAALLFSAFPIWGGVLLIISTQRRAPLRALVLSFVLYLLLCAVMTLVLTTSSTDGNLTLMDYWLRSGTGHYAQPDAFQLFVSRGWDLGRKGSGGGALGMLLAWPLWKTIGVIPGVALLVLLTIADGLALFRVDVKALIDRARSQSAQRREQADDAQRQRELAWQQAQAAQASHYSAPSATVQPPVPQPAPVWPQGNYAPAQQPTYAPEAPMPAVAPAPYNGYGFSPVEDEAYAPVTPDDMVREQADYTAALREQEQNASHKPRLPHIFARRQEKGAVKEKPAVSPARRSMQDTQRTQQTPYQPQQRPMQAPQQTPYQPQQRSSQAPQQESYQPQQRPMQAPQQEPYQPQQPSAHQRSIWEDSSSYSTASWRNDDSETAWPQPTPRRAASVAPTQRKPETDEEETPITRKLHRMQQHQEIEPPPQEPRPKQRPLPSWSEIPPWEEPSKPQTLESVPTPRVQMDTPKDGWKPELKLPPRKAAPEEEAPAKAVEIPYIFPTMSLLKTPEPPSALSAEEDALRSRRLEETLQSFKIPAQVRHVTHGPAISRFELELAAGIRVNKITELDRNIAMNMEVKSVRIEAPIPGKSLVGVEVPNRRVSTVTLREVLETPVMQNMKSTLGVALGKDIAGEPIACDLSRMPHLLIAGATGSGKSVCINAIINSILFRASPKEVRLILVDPKVVELQCYNGIPHLLIPVVSDPHKAAGALEWAVAEMMERYRKFTDKGVREINGYNQKLEDGEEYMPRIVIIIDELADLMMTCRKDVEERICRLAQLARAAGIHLVVATQRPSVDVITGLIKANIPSRIAFKVSSFVDSRTILDRPGAEKLLGYGDMLYLPNGEFTPIRVQGCFLSDGEVNRITDFIRQTSPAEYDPNVIEQLENMERAAADSSPDDVSSEDEASSDDSLLQQAIEMTVQDGQTSTSMLQRRLRIGYARAGRLVDEMEKRGIVSQKDGAKPRMCLISRDEFEHLKRSGSLEE